MCSFAYSGDAVDDSELDGALDALEFTSGLANVLTDLLGRLQGPTRNRVVGRVTQAERH